jgi:antitoxin MazE6
MDEPPGEGGVLMGHGRLGMTGVILSPDSMKTAVSIPDDVFEAAERAAKRAGISRSRFYAEAIRRHLEARDRQDVTARLNAVYDHVDSSMDPVIDALQIEAILKWSKW